jgi:hypothetical protein
VLYVSIIKQTIPTAITRHIRVTAEKVIVGQPMKKLLVFYGT